MTNKSSTTQRSMPNAPVSQADHNLGGYQDGDDARNLVHAHATGAGNESAMSHARGQSHTAAGEIQTANAAPGYEPPNMAGCDPGAAADTLLKAGDHTSTGKNPNSDTDIGRAADRASAVATIERLDANEIEAHARDDDIRGPITYDAPPKQVLKEAPASGSGKTARPNQSGQPAPGGWGAAFELDRQMHPHARTCATGYPEAGGSAGISGGKQVGSACDAATAPAFNSEAGEINPYSIPVTNPDCSRAGG